MPKPEQEVRERRGRAKAAGGGGDKSGESGDNATAVAGDKGGETGTGLSAENTRPEDAPPAAETEEAAGTTALDRLEAVLDDVAFDDPDSLVFEVRDCQLEFIKRLPKPWGITPFDQQQDVAAAAEQFAKDLVRKIVEAVASNERATVRALLVKYDEGDDIKVTLKVKPFDDDEAEQAIVALHRARGKHVLITVASADDYAVNRTEPQLLVDAPELSFDAGGGNDEDLARGPGDDNRRVNVMTGYIEQREEEGGLWIEVERATLDEIREAGDGLYRVNLKSGMIENLPQGCDSDDEKAWNDVRAAEPAELAAERERLQADFDPE